MISIHAPLAGCDSLSSSSTSRVNHFNPRTPCGVRQGYMSISNNTSGISIHAPLAGCDPVFCRPRNLRGGFQSTHPLRGATRRRCCQRLHLRISIHAPLAGCDSRSTGRWTADKISIHAPLAGCDSRSIARTYGSGYFNPRTPCGVRQQKRTKKTALFLN